MRRTNQSMYQPSGNPAHSKLSSSTLENLQGNKSALNVSGMRVPKKVEGHDLGKTTKSNFEQTISQLKSRPTQKVLQDEYINGLQDEIKYLEYELKLLKDKEMMQREGVNELDNFLKDEIPINENILAMKNKYNATKAKLEEQLKDYNFKNNEASDVLTVQRNQIERLHQIIDAHRTQTAQRKDEFKHKLAQIVRERTLTCDEYASLLEHSRRMQEEIKKMNEEISVIQITNEKEKVSEIRSMQQKSRKYEKFEEKSRQTKEDMIETTQKCEQLEALQEVNPLLNQLQDLNSGLRRRCMLNEKQKSSAENTITQIQLYLNEQSRERQLERQHKQKYIVAADESRAEIQLLQREGETMLQDRTIRAKKVGGKEISNELQERDDLYEMLSERLRNLEQECSDLIGAKKEMGDLLQEQVSKEKDMEAKLNQTQASISAKRSTADSLQRVAVQLASEIVPLGTQLQKIKGRLPTVEREIQRKGSKIHYLNKQVDLLKELKSLDLEQLLMIQTGATQVQNVLSSFIQNWEKIKNQ